MNNGINRLIAVTQMKSNEANDEALQGADKQRELIDKMKTVRAAQREFDKLTQDGDYSKADASKINSFIGAIREQGGDVDYVGWGYWTNGEHTEMKIGDGSEWEKKNKAIVDGLKSALEGVNKELEAQDRLGNFEIQDLMSRVNQADTLASSVQKKKDDTATAIIGKV